MSSEVLSVVLVMQETTGAVSQNVETTEASTLEKYAEHLRVEISSMAGLLQD
jgi:hypothetical protein